MKSRFIQAISLCAFILSINANITRSQTNSTPRVLSYQGQIHIPGTCAAGTHAFTITLYSDAAGTQKLWQSTTNTLLDSSGLFNLTLGSDGNPLPEAATMDRQLWLGVSIDGSPELRPLSQLSASPYALNVADSSITAQKLNANYVAGISVNGQPITGKGTQLNLVGGNGVDLVWDPTQQALILNGSQATSGKQGEKSLNVGDPWLEGGNNIDWGSLRSGVRCKHKMFGSARGDSIQHLQYLHMTWAQAH